MNINDFKVLFETDVRKLLPPDIMILLNCSKDSITFFTCAVAKSQSPMNNKMNKEK